ALVRAAVARRSTAGAAQADRIVTQAAESIRGYIRGHSILALVQGVAVAIALWALDVPLAGSVGVVNFIGAFIPYFGAFVGGAFAVLMGLAGGGASLAVLALVVVLFVNLVLENLLEPKLVGSTLRLHPVVVLVSTVAGGLLLGIVGLILAAPTVAIGLNLVRELRDSGFFSAGGATEAALDLAAALDLEDDASEPAEGNEPPT
ncbi:MAG: AI-2E family transporter, partial [Acidimicrobiia bacterium]